MKLARTPVDLAGLLACCETNYWRLLALLPARQAGAVRAWAIGGAQPLHGRITVTAVAPYTTVLDIRQCPQQSPWLPGFALQVHACHDAQVAEVIACQGVRRLLPAYDYPNPAMHQRDEKQGWNAFLGEWLLLCRRHGRDLQPVRVEGLDA